MERHNIEQIEKDDNMPDGKIKIYGYWVMNGSKREFTPLEAVLTAREYHAKRKELKAKYFPDEHLLSPSDRIRLGHAIAFVRREPNNPVL